MDQKNIETVLQALAEKIRDLELEVSLRDYDIKKLNEENANLRTEIKRLLGLPDPIIKKENGHV